MRRRFSRVWFNDGWKPGSDAKLYAQDGLYATAQESNMVGAVLRAIQELGAAGTFRTAKRFLDYGCGTGTLLDTMCLFFGDERVAGYDPITRAEMPEGKFDAITCVHVIEHAADPMQLLRDIRAKLAPGGKLFLVCHNCIGYPNKRADCEWHRWIFGKNVVPLMEAEGYKVEGRITWGGSMAKMRWIKEAVNLVRKRLGLGDVQMIMAEAVNG